MVKATTKKGAVDNDESVILDYLNKQNRPYSAKVVSPSSAYRVVVTSSFIASDLLAVGRVDIFNNLHGAVGKTAVTKALASLTAGEKIIEKEYGKQHVYCPRQDQFEIPDEAELDQLDQTIDELRDQLREENVKVSGASMKTVDIIARVAALRTKNAANMERLEKLKTGTKLVSSAEIARVKKNYTTAHTAWRSRKKMCMNVIDQVMESYPKPKAHLIDLVKMETDEEVGVNFASMPAP
ncbi:hypothetical protein CAOG_06147 [Capsaspora owczarzaki ATCC 30864]|uniref:hypothetical protein n=1 Tax=Capsaspora owczarzaki (strain ATCC 30864) TaxID=595528 RepID=UPI0001FE2761|nr:hypothetical protein CAOG_06147 [Capsaspora owczarzaki ATCC 30864]|eukprot:XP_004345737.1 hypothetical protein CAOG_06147 [Capsaspora owczarzaki ATCC 30864]